MKKHIYLLPIFILILPFLLGTSLPFGSISTIDTATANNNNFNVRSVIDTLLNDIPIGLNASDLPVVQQQENLLQSRLQDSEVGWYYSTYVTGSTVISQQVPSTTSQLETEKPIENQVAEKVEETKKPEEQAKPAPKPTPSPNVQQIARVTANTLNVRTGPSASNDQIDVLTQGQTVEILAEQNAWYQIKLPDSQIGWVSGQHTTVITPEAGSSSLAGKIIVIDPGHGGPDPGAVGVSGLREKDVILDVSLRVADSLRAMGAEVILTRDKDIFIPLSQRVAIAKTAGADVYVSIHANAHPDPLIGGTETYYFRNKANSNASFNLASYLQRELVSALGIRDIGVKHGNFLVIRQTSMPSALVELGFLSNSREEALMRTNEFRQHSADAIVRGLKNYFL